MFSPFRSLKTRIFALFVVLIIPVVMVALMALVQQIQDREYTSFENNLTEAKDFAGFFLESRYEITEALGGSIKSSIADDAIFAKGLSERDIFYVLEPIRSRLDTDLLMAINSDGAVVGQILRISKDGERPLRRGRETGSTFRYFDDMESLELDGVKIYHIQDNYYLFSINKVEVAEQVIGWIGIGYLLDDHVARAVSENFTAGYMVKFVLRNASGECQLIGSSNPDIPALADVQDTCEDLSDQLAGVVRAEPFPLGGVGDQTLEVDVYGSLDPLFANLQEWQVYFSTLIAAVLAVSLLGAYLIASLIANPVRQLVQKAKYIASGHYDEPVAVTDSGELGQLAQEFNVMQHAVLEREKEIVHRAYHDPLTRLPNRSRLFVELEELSNKPHESHTLFLIKVNHIKEINETLGHQTGDDVINFVSEQLRTIQGEHMLARLQMDEFALLVRRVTENQIATWIDRIEQIMLITYFTEGITLQLDARVGIASSLQTMDLLRMADVALHRAELNKVPHMIFDPSIDEEQAERLALMADLRTAVTDNQLLLHYQPKMDIKSGIVTKAEALIRWQHPERGMVRPDKFIEIAENTGQMDSVSTWVLEEAARQHCEWRSEGVDVSIAVNISAENLKNERFAEQVFELFKRHELSNEAICLEITESAVVDNPESAIDQLVRLRDAGLHISVDDYGTGYSSLAQLKHLPIHELKIDKSFVDNLPDDENDRIIVQSTIEMAHSMGLTVVAEGIETEESLKWLHDNGCELAQGYHISRPLPAAEFYAWLKDFNSDTASQTQAS